MASATSSTFHIDYAASAETKSSEKMFDKERFADLHFLIKEGGVMKRIPAHRAILITASDVFDTMLNDQWKKSNEVEIEGASFDAFKEFLRLLYLAKGNVSPENVCEVFNLAKQYNVSSIALWAQQIINQLTLENVCAGFDVALLFDLGELKDQCMKKISEETKKVLATAGFRSCSKNALKGILAISATDCNEIEIFNACLDWAKQSCETKEKDPSVMANVKDELGECLHAIRFGAMQPAEIKNCISKNEGLFNQSEINDLLLTIKADKSQVKIFTNFTARLNHNQPLKCNIHADDGLWEPLDFNKTESVTFAISKSLWFKGISLCTWNREETQYSIKGKLLVFEIEPNHKKNVLEQEIAIRDYPGEKYLEFGKAVHLRENTEYEVRIEIKTYKLYNGSKFEEAGYGKHIGPNRKIEFGNGIVLYTKNKCSDYIQTLHFNFM